MRGAAESMHRYYDEGRECPDREDIEKALKNDISRLRFRNGYLEESFLGYFFSNSIQQARISVLVGAVIYASYGLLDHLMFREFRATFWSIRYGVVVPLLLLIFLALFAIRREALLQLLLSMVIMIAGASVIVFNRIVDGNFYIGLILIILYGCVVMPMRVRYAAASSLLITFAYIYVIGLQAASRFASFNNIFDPLAVDVFGILACYLLEKYKRKEYLHHCLLNSEKDRFRALSLIDGLTEIANRRAFDEFVSREWNRALRTGESVALLLIDVDHFKLYNDAMGHLAGDECLCKIARILQLFERRAGDYVARYGGEEFAFLLTGSTREYAREVAESVRRKVMDIAMPHPVSSTESVVTVSIGGAFCIPAHKDQFDELFRTADNALYRAKNEGRNRVVFMEF